MNIDELKKRKQAAERRIAKIVNDEIQAFKTETGVVPAGMNFATRSTSVPTTSGLKSANLVIYDVELEVKL